MTERIYSAGSPSFTEQRESIKGREDGRRCPICYWAPREAEEAKGSRDVLSAQRGSSPGWLLPGPAACHLVLEKEPPSSRPIPFPPPWEFMATKLSATPKYAVPGMEQGLTMIP